jgi:hypothetical protein
LFIRYTWNDVQSSSAEVGQATNCGDASCDPAAGHVQQRKIAASHLHKVLNNGYHVRKEFCRSVATESKYITRRILTFSAHHIFFGNGRP